MTGELTAWGSEGLNRSAWLRRYRAAINMAVQALAHPALPSWTPEEILGHIRAQSVQAPCEAYAVALRQNADHRQATQGLSRTIVRLRQAALLAEAGEAGEQPPPPLTTRTLEIMQAHVAPYDLEPIREINPYSGQLTGRMLDPRTGQPLATQTEARQAPGP